MLLIESAMPADDHPFDALKRYFELEDSSTSPVTKTAVNVFSRLPLMWPFDKAIAMLKDHLGADSLDRIRIMLETCMNEVRKHENDIRKLFETLSAQESQQRTDAANELLVDATRKAINTRAIDRVKRIGLILANGTIEAKPTDGDEIEEMMRVAMELSDNDVRYLRELVRIEGGQVAGQGRVTRHSAHTLWEQGFWGTHLDGELDSVFSKLESYGLVARIPPPNNLNIMADFQNRYVLLKKGLRFVTLVKRMEVQEPTHSPA
jgi:hypothetical protein